MLRNTTPLVLLALLAVGAGRAESDSGPAAVLEEQTRRRRQEEIARLSREQAFDRSRFEHELNRFDQRAARKAGTLRYTDERRLHRRLEEIREGEARTRAHREQQLRRLELDDRGDDFRQMQTLERLRHRQRADAFVNRQKMRLRRSQLNTPGRR